VIEDRFYAGSGIADVSALQVDLGRNAPRPVAGRPDVQGLIVRELDKCVSRVQSPENSMYSRPSVLTLGASAYCA
jgi:hypothetical protein